MESGDHDLSLDHCFRVSVGFSTRSTSLVLVHTNTVGPGEEFVGISSQRIPGVIT
jgi:hypothetical protein